MECESNNPITMQDIEQFLIANKDLMHEETVIQTLNNHGKLGETINYLKEIDRHDKIVYIHMRV